MPTRVCAARARPAPAHAHLSRSECSTLTLRDTRERPPSFYPERRQRGRDARTRPHHRAQAGPWAGKSSRGPRPRQKDSRLGGLRGGTCTGLLGVGLGIWGWTWGEWPNLGGNERKRRENMRIWAKAPGLDRKCWTWPKEARHEIREIFRRTRVRHNTGWHVTIRVAWLASVGDRAICHTPGGASVFRS